MLACCSFNNDHIRASINVKAYKNSHQFLS
jgi:hypothetical protein